MLYKSLNWTVIGVIVVGVGFAGLLPELFNRDNKQVVKTFIEWYLAITGVVYCTLAVFFVVSLVKLIRKLRQEEAKNNFKSRRVKVVSIAFAAAYVFHTVIFVWAAF